MKIPVEISARHLHLSRVDSAKLFGSDHRLRIWRRLSQNGEFAAKETLSLVGPKGQIVAARIVGPWRAQTQVEISLTDAMVLGLKPPVRLSGDLSRAATITLVGPVGSASVRAAIIAQRHLHLNPTEAKKLKLKNGQKIRVAVGDQRRVIFDGIIVRVAPHFKLALHLDTDEANAAGLVGQKVYGRIVK